MTELRIEIPRPWRDLFDRAPQVLEKALRRAVHRAAEEGAREAKDKAPKASSTLTNSTRAQRRGPLAFEVAAGVDYAPMVETGTGLWGPAGAPGNRLPPVQSLEDWIKVRRIQPDDPDMDSSELAYLIARSIASRGTPAQPFMGPAFSEIRRRGDRILRREMERGLQQAGLG